MMTDEEREKYTSPGTYVHFTPRSKADPAVRYAKKLCSGLETNCERIRAIKREVYKYNYDTKKAETVEPGYTPDIETIIKERKGICLDLAVLMVMCLRIFQIPAKLCIGHVDGQYHAWCEVYIKEAWELYDPVFRGTYKDDEYQTEKVY